LSKWLIDYCCSQDGLFVIPIEALSSSGITSGFGEQLREQSGVSSNWISQFNRAYSIYWNRARALHARAPGYWFPPRPQHIAIITRPAKIRPYFQPFHQNSWLLYQHDFDSDYATPEFSVFQFFQAERMGLMAAIVPAMHANLPYFLTLSGSERKGFTRGCKLTDRPDAAAYRELGAAQSWLKLLFHEDLKPPRVAIPGMRIHRENGLIVPPEQGMKLAALQDAWGAVAQDVFSGYRAGHENDSSHASGGLSDWLSQQRPQALITGAEGQILWDPDDPDHHETLEPALAALTETGDHRIRQDLLVVDGHSRRFLSSLRNPEALVRPAPYMTEGGLSYIHPERRLMAYDIGPGRNENRLWEPSPPFERWMLGARTIHEWGHLAAESGWVKIPDDRLQQRQAMTEQLAGLFDEIPASASPRIRKRVAKEEQRLADKHGSFGKGLLAAMLRRIEDYMANLVAQRYLSSDEMDTYVRNNVASRVTEYTPAKVYLQLIRLVYEYQYLSLSRIESPLKWLYKSTWVGPMFVERGVITRQQFEKIVETVSGICDCYEVDQSRFAWLETGTVGQRD